MKVAHRARPNTKLGLWGESRQTSSVCQVVEDRLLKNNGVTAFAVGLARGIRKLRTSGVVTKRSARGRVLRAMGLCISEIVGTGKHYTSSPAHKLFYIYYKIYIW